VSALSGPCIRPAWLCKLVPLLCGVAGGGCEGLVWNLGGTRDAAAGVDAAIAVDEHDDAAVPPPDTSTVAQGAPWPLCVNGQCSQPWLHCDANAGLCVPCVHNINSMQCPMDAPHTWLGVCDLVPGDPFEDQCVECLDSHDCGDNEVCNAYQCIPVCLNGMSCPGSRSMCDRTRSLCVSCFSPNDCQHGESCNSDTGACGCASDSDCQPPEVKCDLRDNECVECLTSADCNGGVCDPQTQTCLDAKM